MTAAPDRILLTGASGFVAHHLRPMLTHAFPASALIASSAELTDPAAIEADVHATRPDICIHLAAISTVRGVREREERAWDVNLHGTLRLARAILRHVPGCTLLFASSAEAYGRSFRSGLALTEAAPLAPMNIYGATKAAADLAVGAMVEQGLRVIRLRPFNHTGAGQTEAFVVPAFARNIARIEAGAQPNVITVGNLDASRDFLDVRDVCSAYIACVERRDSLPSGTILNLASGQPRRIGDILADLLSLSGVRPAINVDPALLRTGDLPVTRGDATAAERMLGWRPRIAWTDTLRTVLDDWRARATDGTNLTAPTVSVRSRRNAG